MEPSVSRPRRWGALGGIGATTAWLIGGPLVDGLAGGGSSSSTSRSGWPRSRCRPCCCARAGPRAVDEAPGAGWGDVRTILPLADSAVLVAAFALIESRHPAPLVQLRIFRSRTLAGADALTILIGTVAVGMPLVLTLYAQQVLGYSALKFGISSVVLALGPRPARSPARPRSARPASARPPRPA